uniref:Uncharacterized protein n=1 Tax=Anas zonorhyncha TaxID=75864 RepID=A0A8B9VLE6_9AVES
MSGAGGERPPLPSAPPAKLRRLDSPAGPGLEASPPAGNPESSSTPDGSPERGKLGLEAGGRCRGGLETATGRCWEQSTNGKRRLRPKGGLETTNGSGSEQSTSGKRRSEAKGGLETTTRSENGGLEPTPEPEGSLETATTPKGGLETATTPKGSLETATTGCPEQNGEAKGQKKRPNPEDCAVISLGEEEEDEEEEGDEGPGRYLAALEAVQLELEAVEEEAARAFRRLRAKFGLRRRPHLQRRNHLIQHIPGFWVTAFLNHPQLSAMISDRDEDALSYMTGLQVEEFGPTRPGCRIRFFFSGNPYFQNRVVAKEFVRGPSGHLVSHSTPIRWWQGQDPRCRPHKGRPAPRSFFAWFGDHSFPAGDRVAEDPNTVPPPPHSESGEDSVVIVEDDEDVQEILDDGDGSGVEEVVAEPPQDRRTDPKGDRG